MPLPLKLLIARRRVLRFAPVALVFFGLNAQGQCPTCPTTDCTTGCTITISSGTNVNVNANLGVGDKLCIQSGVTVTGWNVNFNSPTAQAVNCGTFNLGGNVTLNGQVTNNGTMNFNNLTVNGNGTVCNAAGASLNANNIQNNGDLSNAGSLSTTGNFTNNGGSTLCLTGAGTVDISGNFTVNGDVVASGTSNCITIGGVSRLNGGGTVMGTLDICDGSAGGSTFDIENGTVGAGVSACDAGAACGILPVVFAELALENNAGQWALRWEVAREVNTQYYRVETGPDWASVAQVGAVGATTYRSALPQGSTGDIYRVVAIDFDGNRTYSPSIEVSGGALTASVAVFQNPTTAGQAALVARELQNVPLQVIWRTSTGQVVASDSFTPQTSTAVFVSPENLSAGLYLAEVRTPAAQWTHRVILR